MTMSSGWSVLLAAVAVTVWASCGPSPAQAKENDLSRGVAHAKRTLELANTDLMAALSFREIRDLGGDVVTYVTANSDDGASLPPYRTTDPEQPWVVVIRDGASDGVFLIEGYGEDLDEPLLVETVTVTAAPAYR